MLNEDTPERVVRLWDDAIDWGDPAEDGWITPAMIAYRDTRDFSKLSPMPGRKPMVFHIKALSNETALDVIGIEPLARRCVRAFALAVVKVEDGCDAAGKPLASSWIPAHVETAGAKRGTVSRAMTDAETKLFPLAIQIEIGQVALSRAFFDPTTERGFALPPTSLQIWVGYGLRRAELARSTRNGESAERPPLPMPTPDATSAAPGDATATVEATSQAAQ